MGWRFLRFLGNDNNNNGVATTNVAANADGSILERLEFIQAGQSGTAGIATFPAAAVPANNVSLAEVIRDIWDSHRNGTGGSEPGTNKSIIDALGFDGAARIDAAGGIGYDMLALPRCVVKTDGAVLNGNDDIFTISGGPVKAQIFGLVTTVIGGAANGRLKHTTTAPAATVDLNAGAVAIDADAVGTFYHNVGATGVFTPSSGLGFKIIDPVTVEDVWYALAPGTVHFNGSAAQTGVIAWYMRYVPLSPLSRVAAAA